MDKSIEKINEYRANTSIEHAPVILKRSKGKTAILTYLVFPCTKLESDFILEHRALGFNILKNLTEQQYINKESDIKEVYHCGKLIDFGGFRELVYKFPQRKIDIRNRVEPIYRFYEFSLERQKQHINVHNMAPTAEHSWNSVLRKVGTEYGLVIKIITLNNGNTL